MMKGEGVKIRGLKFKQKAAYFGLAFTNKNNPSLGSIKNAFTMRRTPQSQCHGGHWLVGRTTSRSSWAR
jgi:hypothetical protein